MKKFLSLILALVLSLGCTLASAEAVKHERVFAVLNAAGEVQSLTDSIRLENPDGEAELADRTGLSDIQNVSGHETFTLEGETLTWQAGGRDIIYEGRSDQPLPFTPKVTFTLDGSEVSAAELKDRAGTASVTVKYEAGSKAPHLAATLVLLPESGVNAVRTENAELLSVAGRQAVLGWAVPGADPLLKLPSSFSFSFEADHANLDWMMTFASADPVDAVLKEIDQRMTFDPHTELEEIGSLVTALQTGAELPETTGLTKGVSDKVNELNQGLETLDTGAKDLASGASELSTGASTLSASAALLNTGASTVSSGSASLAEGIGSLKEGLDTLSESSAALTEGADTLFTAILDAANQQLAASGLAEAGLTLPALTTENWQETLTAALTQLEAEPYGSLAQLDPVREALKTLAEQLTRAEAFVTGVKAYTAGVDQAASGAKDLKTGAATLQLGAKELSGGTSELAKGAVKLAAGAKEVSDGAAKLHEEGTSALRSQLLTAEKTAAAKALPIVKLILPKALSVYESTRDGAAGSGYDLRPEGMKTITAYILRTDFQ